MTEPETGVDGSLRRVPCVVMRGGTSRAVFFAASDLPDDPAARDETILSVMGSPHPRQIDGLGGADTLTSKIVIVAPAEESGVDVTATFGQVSIDRPTVDYDVSCGNTSAAVGYYAIEEGLVTPTEPTTTVRIRDTSTGLVLTNELPVVDGVPQVTGDHAIHGVPGTGARVTVGMREPGGNTTGAGLLPTGSPRDEMTIDGTTVPYSYVDAGNPYVFVGAETIGCDATELPAELDNDERVMGVVEQLRRRLAVQSGIAADRQEAIEEKTVLPAVVLVSEPTDYVDFENNEVSATAQSLTCRLIVEEKLHKAYAGTGVVCTAVASQIDGTIVADRARPFEQPDGDVRITIGHPSGLMNGYVDSDSRPAYARFERTARRIMGGVAYARPDLVE